MRLRTQHRITAFLTAACVVVLAGCAPYAGNGYQPIGYGPSPYYPGTPYGSYPNGGTVPVNYPGGNPPIIWGPITPTPNPNTPRPPDKPVVLEPVPQKPDPGNDPGPNVPVNYPVPTSPDSPEVNSKWAPWPLPPRGTAQQKVPNSATELAAAPTQGQQHAAATAPRSQTVAKYDLVAADDSTIEGPLPGSGSQADGAAPAVDQDLHYRGGKTLQHISYVNLYVGGEAAGWKLNEVENIENSIAAALNDQGLNNVIMQYFNNQPISATPYPCHPLIGYKPSTVTRADLQSYLEYLADQNYLRNYDLNTTVFNFLLPSGTVLSDADHPAGTGAQPSEDISDSHSGLAGYHGSVPRINKPTLYFSVEVYSERYSDGTMNGIPVFLEAWKNVCATLYHEICEFRTDPDVEDANRDPNNPSAEKHLGWVTDEGLEIGDGPLESGAPLRSVITEVPLANGQGNVPVQLIYSNAVHGHEGPIATPHPVPAQ